MDRILGQPKRRPFPVLAWEGFMVLLVLIGLYALYGHKLAVGIALLIYAGLGFLVTRKKIMLAKIVQSIPIAAFALWLIWLSLSNFNTDPEEFQSAYPYANVITLFIAILLLEWLWSKGFKSWIGGGAFDSGWQTYSLAFIIVFMVSPPLDVAFFAAGYPLAILLSVLIVLVAKPFLKQ
tara:strand:- start:810 stop:1346 length:537 start_codon:yes stop_codon:yes gene_type:complete